MAASSRHSRESGDPVSLITNNLDIWSSATNAKSAAGRGTSKKLELYGIKKLRELILELAVRGLLVPQDAGDEPASELLKKIALEKERLVKEGKIKKQKPLLPIDEEEKQFALPIGWEWVRLGNLIYLEMGQSPPSKFYNQEGNGIPFFQGKADFGDKYPTPRYWCIQPQKYSYPNDVLLSVRAPVGPTNISNIECCIGRGLAALRPLLEVPTNFVDYLVKGFRSTLESFATGTTFVAVSKTDVEGLIVSVPPLAEQHRIVAKVDELMALCDQLEQQTEASISAHKTLVQTLLETLTNASERDGFNEAWARIAEHFDTLFTTEWSIDQLKQTILQLAVMGKLVPQNPNDEPASKLLKKIAIEKAKLIKEGKIKKQKSLPPILEDEKQFGLPEGWGFAHMQDLCTLITDGTHLTPKYSETGRPFISAQCVKPFRFIPDNCRYVSEEHYQGYIKNRKPEFRDILLARVGAGIGEAAVIDTDLEFAIYVSTGLLKPHHDFLSSEYLVIWLNSPVGRKFSAENTLGIGVSQGNLNLSLIRKFLVSVPPKNEQNHIVAKVDELMALCDDMRIKINTAQITQLNLADAMAEQALN